MYKDKIRKIFGKDINDELIQYCCTKYPQWSNNNFKLSPLINENIILNENFTEDELLNYIRYKKSINIVTIWTMFKYDDIEKYMTSIGAKILYFKKIKLSTKGINNLLYQLYADYETVNDIKSKIDNDYDNTINIIIIDNIKKEYIELIKLSINEMIQKRNCIMVSDNYYHTICQSRIYLCENSIKFLELQNLDEFMKIHMKKSRIMLATFRNWFFKTCSLEDQEKVILFSGSILYSLGIRKINDLDIYISDNSDIDINKYFIDNDTRFPFIDSTIKNTVLWKSHWNRWEKEWLNKVGASSFEEIISNSKYHYYFLGIKFMLLDCDIYRRQKRYRPKAFCDLIKINKIININIPKIPKTKRTFIHLKEGETIESYQLNDNMIYNKENNEIIVEEPIDEKYFINTMIKYFRYVYNEEWTQEMLYLELKSKVKIIIKRK